MLKAAWAKSTDAESEALTEGTTDAHRCTQMKARAFCSRRAARGSGEGGELGRRLHVRIHHVRSAWWLVDGEFAVGGHGGDPAVGELEGVAFGAGAGREGDHAVAADREGALEGDQRAGHGRGAAAAEGDFVADDVAVE